MKGYIAGRRNSPETVLCLIACLLLVACHGVGPSRESALRAVFYRNTGHIRLPAGVVELHAPLQFQPGAHDIDLRGHESGSILRLAENFKGKAAIMGTGVANVRLAGFQILGTRGELISNLYLPNSNTRFVDYYDENGIVFTDSRGVTIENVTLRNIRTFPVLISHSSTVVIDSITIEDSGTLNSQGHSNTTGGVLLEEGTKHFTVKHCRISKICGNGIWTHSNFGAPRNEDGLITGNAIWGTPRDAIQVGHAIGVRVLDNGGGMVGFPSEQADLPGGATPVAIDSAGDVSGSSYSGNHFEGVNGQCIDLDGFHDGRVLNNSCVNRRPPIEYPLSHFGIVFGNSNPEMVSQRVVVNGNVMQGFGYGGIYLIGEGHEVFGNRFIDVNRNQCTGDMSTPRCNYAPEEPGMLRSGMYLASHAARRTETKRNRIYGNYISGFGMDRWCITAGPGVALGENKIDHNICVGSGQTVGVRRKTNSDVSLQ